MKTKLMKRLRSQAGESIAEVLIATLIAALALVMLATMISSTVSQVNTSKRAMEKYYSGNAALEQQKTASDTATITITITNSGTTTGGTTTGGTTTGGTTTGGAINMTVSSVNLYENTGFNSGNVKDNVYAYQK